MSITNGILSIKELLDRSDIVIPQYQRPYKWSIKNVNQLLDDIIEHCDKSAYRLGTIVFHKAKNKDKQNEYNIVDGQQRTITLLLISLAIANNKDLVEILEKESMKPYTSSLFESLQFDNRVSQKNIWDNYREIERRVKAFDFDTVEFFYNRCQFVQVVLEDVSEAFQFFDSQNSRGKDLDPHDLLKAFHLREMIDHSSEEERIKTVAGWEDIDTEKLKDLFANYLFRIRNWTKGYSARIFTKDDVALFKGVSPDLHESFPFAHLYRIGHFYIDSYNSDYNRKIDRNRMEFPFQVDGVMINGKRFFEFIEFYKKSISTIHQKVIESSSKESISQKILKTLQSYEGRGRTGDRYVYNLFYCALLYYMDKFGTAELDRAIEKLFIWAYRVRLSQQSVYLATVDNYALDSPFLFRRINDALRPSDLLSITLSPLQEVRSSKTEELEAIFREVGYLYEQ